MSASAEASAEDAEAPERPALFASLWTLSLPNAVSTFSVVIALVPPLSHEETESPKPARRKRSKKAFKAPACSLIIPKNQKATCCHYLD